MAPNDTQERAEAGKELLAQQRAQGAPGEKQPEHKDNRLSAEDTLKELDKLQEKIAVPTKESSAKRSQESGNPNPTPPQERKREYAGDQNLALANAAAQQVSGARTQLTAQLEADARLTSDPRYERDQKIFEMGRQGTLQYVPPSEAEAIAESARAGVPPEAAQAIPRTPEEQAADDMKRLEQAEKTAEQVRGSAAAAATRADEKGTIRPGQSEYRSPEKPAPEPEPTLEERKNLIK